MIKILFLPLLQLSSGHHQVVKALEAWFKQNNKAYKCESIDIFSYAFRRTESLVSRSYLHAIQYLPSLYSWVYKKNVFDNKEKDRFLFYEMLFERAMIKLIDEKNPNWLICTQALPSYIINRLKQKQKIDLPVVNVYTDYFINCLWGTEMIDYHLVPDQMFKDQLIQKGVQGEKIYVTGIPIHPSIQRIESVYKPSNSKYNILITGGSLGVGNMITIVRQLRPSSSIDYYVLCGKNKRLYDTLKEKNSYVTPLPYIESPDEMNKLYNDMDGIVTKPGGVTITESLNKRLPIFIYHTLPGQEEMNLNYLLTNELVFDLRDIIGNGNVSDVIYSVLLSEEGMYRYRKKVDFFHKRVSTTKLKKFIQHIG